MKYLAIIFATLITGTAHAQATYGASIDVQGVGAFEIMEGDESPEIEFEFWARSNIEFNLGYLKWLDATCPGYTLTSANMLGEDGSCGYSLLMYGGHSNGSWSAPRSDAPAGTWNPLSKIKIVEVTDSVSNKEIKGSFYLQVQDDNCYVRNNDNHNRLLQVQACTLAGGGFEICSPLISFNIIDDDTNEELKITYNGCFSG